jgi:hypothetical protein
MVGDWRLNTAKSRSEAGSVPKSGIARIMQDSDGLTVQTAMSNTDAPPGRGVTSHFYLDGKERPANDRTMTVVRTRKDHNTIVGTFKKGGQVVSEETWSVSADGKTLTRTQWQLDDSGKKVTLTYAYERQ